MNQLALRSMVFATLAMTYGCAGLTYGNRMAIDDQMEFNAPKGYVVVSMSYAEGKGGDHCGAPSPKGKYMGVFIRDPKVADSDDSPWRLAAHNMGSTYGDEFLFLTSLAPGTYDAKICELAGVATKRAGVITTTYSECVKSPPKSKIGYSLTVDEGMVTFVSIDDDWKQDCSNIFAPKLVEAFSVGRTVSVPFHGSSQDLGALGALVEDQNRDLRIVAFEAACRVGTQDPDGATLFLNRFKDRDETKYLADKSLDAIKSHSGHPSTTGRNKCLLSINPTVRYGASTLGFQIIDSDSQNSRSPSQQLPAGPQH